jgi:hypothetical protein
VVGMGRRRVFLGLAGLRIMISHSTLIFAYGEADLSKHVSNTDSLGLSPRALWEPNCVPGAAAVCVKIGRLLKKKQGAGHDRRGLNDVRK